MNRLQFTAAALLLGATILSGSPTDLSAQLGRQQGLVEPNVASDADLAALPNVNQATVDAIKAARPILSATALDQLLASRSLTAAQRTALYARAFVHVDLNRGTDAEFNLIPGMNAAILQAIKSGRPWRSFEAFRTAIGQASTPAEAERLEQYLFIPINLNTWTDPIMDSFASIGVGTARWKREFAEYRPWTSMAQFDREIGKYVRNNPSELTRLARYVIIEP